MKNKNYIVLYSISGGISIATNIQTWLTLSTGKFFELNPLGHNWFTILLTVLFYLFLLIPFFIKDKTLKKVFLIGIIYVIIIGLIVFIHDVIVIVIFMI